MSDLQPNLATPESRRGLPPGVEDRAPLGELRRSVSEVTRILYLRRWLFFVPLCVVMTSAFVMSLYVPRRYVVSTTFERRDDPVLVNLPRNEGSGAFASFQRTLPQDVTNVDSLVDVVQQLNLDRTNAAEAVVSADVAGASRNDNLVRRIATQMAKGLEVRFVQQTELLDVIEITYTSANPQRMTETLDEVRDQYIRSTQQRITTLLHRTRDWFEAERQKRREIVEALEDDLIQFRTAHQGLDPLNPSAATAKVAELRENLLDLERKQKEYQTQIDGRRNYLMGGNGPAPELLPANLADTLGLRKGPPSAESRRIVTAIQQLDDQIQELKAVRGMTELHPDILTLKKKRDDLVDAQAIAAYNETGAISINGVMEGIPSAVIGKLPDDPEAASRSRAEMEIGIYEKLCGDADAETRKARAEIAEYEEIQKDALFQRKEFSTRMGEVERAHQELALYQGYADQVGRVLTAENSQRGILFGKIKPAAGSTIPASPRAATVIILSLTIGLTTGVVLLLACEIFDRTVRTRRQVIQGLGLPIIESIGEILSSAARRRRALQQYVLAPAAVTVLIVMVLATGALACVSLTNRKFYEQAIATPQSLLHRVSDLGSMFRSVAATVGLLREQES